MHLWVLLLLITFFEGAGYDSAISALCLQPNNQKLKSKVHSQFLLWAGFLIATVLVALTSPGATV